MMILQILKNKFENIFRLFLLNTTARKNNSILLTEYPKSGGSWLGQMLSELMDVDFPRNKLPGLKRSILHGHYLPKLGVAKNKKIVCLIRDGRDVTVSYYFHQLFINEKTILNKKEYLYYRKLYKFENYEDVKSNMPEYIKVLNTHNPSKTFHFFHPTTWSNFYEEWDIYRKTHKNIIFVSYEDLKTRPVETLKELLSFLKENNISDEKINSVVDKFSFKNQSKRNEGEENRISFMRKGIVGDWKNYFNERSKEYFKKYSGKTLIKFNYVKDNKW